VICAVSVTSTCANEPPSSSASARPLSSCTSAITTVAPAAARRRATAAPMPDAAPVTTAEDPEMSMRRSLGHGSCASDRAPARGRAHDSEVGLAARHDQRGSGEVDPPLLVARHLELATWYVDPPPPRPGTGRGHCRRARAGAARPGLARAALVDPHRDVIDPAAYDELDVDALGVQLRVVRRLLGQRPGLREVVEHHDRVRVAGVDVEGRP